VTRAVIDPGICGMRAVVEVDKVARRKVRIKITSDCQKVRELGESLGELDTFEAFEKCVDCAVYQSASSCNLHVSCPVPMAILKTIEIAAGFALPRDVLVRFETPEV